MSDSLKSSTSDDILASLSNELADAVARASRSVVTVYARRRMPGSGIVWSQDGTIVTANHVVERDDDLLVDLGDGENRPATLVGRDPGSDISVLRLEGAEVVPAKGAEREPRPGNLALAVGRPGKNGPVASLGVISVVGGAWRTSEGGSIERFIRSDAAMLPGFSGGPLIDTTGATIGMNSSGVGRRGGLTIPWEALGSIVSAIGAHGRVRRGFFGVGAQSVEIPGPMRQQLGLDQERALLIMSVQSGGPGEQAGLLVGDLILAVGSQPVASVEELQDHLTGDIVGQTVTVSLIRGGQLQSAEVTVGERH
jgi:S1-C subfamily serine protease